jgi:hypothetical protein
MSDTEAVDSMILNILETYIVDYMCKKEMESLGISYNKDYYGASYETLIETFGSESLMLKYIKSFGLDKSYIEELCKKQARRATLSEHILSKYEKTLNITDDMLLEHYLAHETEYIAKEARTLYHVSFYDYNLATEALKQINEQGFMVYYQSQKTAQTCASYGPIEKCEKDWFPTDVGNAIFSAQVGTYIPYVLPTYGDQAYTIIYVESHFDNYQFTYEEMKDAIKESLIEKATDDYLTEYFKQLNEKYVTVILYGR